MSATGYCIHFVTSILCCVTLTAVPQRAIRHWQLGVTCFELATSHPPLYDIKLDLRTPLATYRLTVAIAKGKAPEFKSDLG